MTRHRLLHVLIWVAAALVVLGAVTAALAGDYTIRYGRLADIGLGLFVAGVLAAVAGMAWGHGFDAAETSGEESRANLLQRQVLLKSGTLLLNLMAIVAATLLAGALLRGLGLIDLQVASLFLHRGVLVLVAFGALVHAFVHVEALAQPRIRDRSAVRTVMTFLSMGLAALLAVIILIIAAGREALLSSAGITSAHIDLLIVGILPMLAIALYTSRTLPTIAETLGGQDRSLRAGVGASGKRVMVPIMFAFGLLFLAFFLFLIFGFGVGDIVNLSQNPALLGVLLFLVVALLGSIFAATSLARTTPIEAPLFLQPVNAKRRRERTILLGSLIPAGLLAAVSLYLFLGYSLAGLGPDTWIHFFCAGLLLALGPYGFYAAYELRRIRQLEERFPDFLRDVASSHKGGLTLANSVAIAARGEYGPLTPEIRRMADQLTWNVSFNEALVRFADHVQTPLVQRAVSLILQANKSGGATTEVLLAAARDAREIKSLENERRLSMSLYTVVIYVTFLVFLGVAAIMYAKFVPQLVNASNAAAAQTAATGVKGISESSGEIKLRDFQIFYFMAAIMQGLGDGIVAGMMGQGKAVMGLRHSFLMVLLSYVTFVFFLG